MSRETEASSEKRLVCVICTTSENASRTIEGRIYSAMMARDGLEATQTIVAMELISSLLLLLIATVNAQVTFQNSSGTILRVDNGTYGPPIEEYHYYYDQWPIGLAISSTGRLFVCYTRGTYEYTLSEAVNKTAGKPFQNSCTRIEKLINKQKFHILQV